MSAPEEWRDVLGREGEYEVSSLGRVRSRYRGGRLLNPWLNGDPRKHEDYYRVQLGRGCMRYVHHLVCEAFHGERPDGLYACHGNGDRRDNRAVNLRWDTPSENVADAQRHGTYRAPVRWAERRGASLFGAAA